jgi:hypothetical protein
MNQLALWQGGGTTALWAPIQMEPVVGTNERLTVAVIIDAGFGMRVVSTLRDRFIREAFGESADDFRSLVEMIKRSIEESGCDALSIDEWNRPFEGVYIGEFANAVGSSFEDIVDSASAISSAFYRPRRTRSLQPKTSDHKSRVLEGQVRSSIVESFPGSRGFFGRLIPGPTRGHERRVGFFDDFYAVQFGVLTSGSLGTCRAFAQAKLWDLERLRDTPRLFQDSLELEFIAQDALGASEAGSAMRDLREQLAEDAAKAEIGFVTVTDANSAAHRVLENSVLQMA